MIVSGNNRIHRNASGFTLIEVMVSIFVFTLMAIMFSGTVSASLRAGRLNGQYAQATSLCQHKIDQLRAVGFGRLNYTELSDAGIIDETSANQPFLFTQVDEVESYLPNATTALKIETVETSVVRVTVTISWKKVAYEEKVSTMSVAALITNVE